MHEQSSKFAIIVMDGMSEFDWNIISQSFSNIAYEQTAAFAMIPSIIHRALAAGVRFRAAEITDYIKNLDFLPYECII